jgi:hypothetical protein
MFTAFLPFVRFLPADRQASRRHFAATPGGLLPFIGTLLVFDIPDTKDTQVLERASAVEI